MVSSHYSKELNRVTTDDEWKRLLTPMQYAVLRQAHTERAYTGEFWNTNEAGTYVCAGCSAELFTSADKFDSECGWPSYTRAIDEGRADVPARLASTVLQADNERAECERHPRAH